MIKINANTKISALLKAHPQALDAIISISSKFNKLKNPLLRKLMASRTSIAMASKIGGVQVADFFEKFKSLGFEIDETIAEKKTNNESNLPIFIQHISKENIKELDVRPVINSGNDPFNIILNSVKQLQKGDVLKLINSFEPAPLIPILNKQGFEAFVEHESSEVVNTYFYKINETEINSPDLTNNEEDWQSIIEKYSNNLVTIDVRNLEMPLPMLTILEEIEKIPNYKALYVYHKRIPVFLLPELKERNFDYRTKEITDGEVHLLIFKA
ncbi:MAG TPA: DUF2249 domain-containing protein [Chitinophagaceae bacterium]|nr:DUF2249 domain-containing protein [Chitinophagaceae bacterium]MCC6635378.1 DUF2249 domain-containing protein [Chitinophagaceae bacterium]HMZ45859.1 DUF2249 domain-containing protein [Chitinophagaceae bacterium]HNE92493.1 DUF2249 domain-containing protein [Chitinophagaceae bacterium]HNF29433.1 DUF2249 domain-containing protein [Chitinophagaceae bacterium]